LEPSTPDGNAKGVNVTVEPSRSNVDLAVGDWTWTDETLSTPFTVNFGSPEQSWCLVEELMPDYRGIVARSVVAGALRRATSDLRGSICVEALPEMATRLARFRLNKLLDSAIPARGSAEPMSLPNIGRGV
jgi:hypothetical protein